MSEEDSNTELEEEIWSDSKDNLDYDWLSIFLHFIFGLVASFLILNLVLVTDQDFL